MTEFKTLVAAAKGTLIGRRKKLTTAVSKQEVALKTELALAKVNNVRPLSVTEQPEANT